MAGNNSISILRGSRTNIIDASSDVKLKPGQLLYNKDDMYLTVGGDTDNDRRPNTLPIKVRELHGWAYDSEGLVTKTSKDPDDPNDAVYQEYGISHTDGIHDLNGEEYTDNELKVVKLKYTDGSGTYTQSNIRDGKGVRSIEQSMMYGKDVKGCNAYGKYSVALNDRTKAYQLGSFALGGGTQAGRTLEEFNEFYLSGVDHTGNSYKESSSFAFASGNLNKARGYGSFIGGGRESVADGRYSSIIGGSENIVSGTDSIILGGVKNNVSGRQSIILGGTENIVTGEGSGAFGDNNELLSTGSKSFVFGSRHRVSSPGRFVVGTYSVDNASIFAVGNGSGSQTSNALEVYKDGSVYVPNFAADPRGVVNLDCLRHLGSQSVYLQPQSGVADNSIIGGKDSVSLANNSFTFGVGLSVPGNETFSETVFTVGQYNQLDYNNIFCVGAGTSGNDRKTALRVTQEGYVQVPTPQPTDMPSNTRNVVLYADFLEERILPFACNHRPDFSNGDEHSTTAIRHSASSYSNAQKCVVMGHEAVVYDWEAENSVAIGPGAVAIKKNQVVIGPYNFYAELDPLTSAGAPNDKYNKNYFVNNTTTTNYNLVLGCGTTDVRANALEGNTSEVCLYNKKLIIDSNKLTLNVPFSNKGFQVGINAESDTNYVQINQDKMLVHNSKNTTTEITGQHIYTPSIKVGKNTGGNITAFYKDNTSNIIYIN